MLCPASLFSRRVAPLGLMWLAAPLHLALAQSVTPSELPEVVVTAPSSPSTQLGASVDRLEGEALLQSPTGGLGQTLSGLVGVSSSYFGSTASRPIIRGLDGDRIRILNNGAALNDVSGLSYDHAVASSPLAMERVEVVRGPAALMYGGSGAGGVVNMLDSRIAKQALFDEKGGQLGKVRMGLAGAGQERMGVAMIETGDDRFALHLDAFGNKTGEVNAPLPLQCTQNGVTRIQNKICNTQADTAGGAMGGSVFFDQGYLGASVQRTRQQYGSPAEADVGINMENASYRLEGEKRALHWMGGLIQSVSGHIVSHSYQHRELAEGEVATTFKSTGMDGKLQAKLAPLKLGAGEVKTALGWQRESVNLSAQGSETFMPRTLTQTQALYGLQELHHDWGKLSAGLRMERADVNSLGIEGDANFTPAQRSLSASSYALGGLFKLNQVVPGLTATADLARTGRIPKDYELYANGNHAATGAYERGNAHLPVERSTHQEIGLQWQGERRFDKASLSIFRTRYDNYLMLQSTGQTSTQGTPIFQFAAAAVHFSGWEWTGRTRLVQASPGQPRSVDVALRMSSVQATEQATGTPLARIAPTRTGLDWTLAQGAAKWTLGADRSAAQNRVAADQPVTAGYTLWTLGFSYEQRAKQTQALWFAKLDNASNAMAYPATSILTQTAPGRVPLPGRTLRLGVQFSF